MQLHWESKSVLPSSGPRLRLGTVGLQGLGPPKPAQAYLGLARAQGVRLEPDPAGRGSDRCGW